MTMPTSDGTTEEGEILGENTAAAAADPSFGVVNLGVHKYSSKTVAVPIELLQDSNADIEAFVNNRLITRLGRITNKHFTVGTGSSQPSGVLTGATLGVTGAKAQVDSVTYDDLVELEHSLDPAYREGGRCAFMFADTTLKAIKEVEGRARPTPVASRHRCEGTREHSWLSVCHQPVRPGNGGDGQVRAVRRFLQVHHPRRHGHHHVPFCGFRVCTEGAGGVPRLHALGRRPDGCAGREVLPARRGGLAMTVRLITPPAAEPVTLEMARLHTRAEAVEDDALLTVLITAARQQGEGVTRRVFGESVWEVETGP